MECINPTTEEIRTFEESPIEEIPLQVNELRLAREWRSCSVADRVERLQGLPPALTSLREELAHEIAQEMGKPLAQGRIEVDRSVDEVDYLLRHAVEWIAPEEVDGGWIEFGPLGSAAVISPWNFPLLLPLRAIVPALVAGNGVVFKPSELAPALGIRLTEILHGQHPILKSALRLILGGKDHGRAVVATDVDLIAFTGSTAAGKEIMRVAAERVKRVVLELGGLDAALVLKDADISESAARIVRANVNNSGQACNAVKRVFVEQSVHERFVAEAVKCSKSMRLGPPETDPDMGPLVSEAQLHRVEQFLADAQKQGAKVLTGGARIGQKGFFFPSTVLIDVPASARLLQEEPFGPLLPIIPISSWEEGVRRANETRYGLMASIWTSNEEIFRQISPLLDVGTVCLNSHSPGRSGSPWGGAKESGIGRMKTREGLREFANVKLVRGGEPLPPPYALVH